MNVTEKIRAEMNAFEQAAATYKDARIITALSGGADSVVLLFALLSLRKDLGFSVEACHVNHNLRGIESDSDERFCEQLCADWNVILHKRSVNVNGMKTTHRSIEDCARIARYDFFEALIAADPQTVIATAHNASDNAETILLNLARGTGLKGLCGIPPVRGRIIRPLLTCGAEEVRAFAAANGLRFVTDATNFSDDYTRNKIRNKIMPVLREINPSFEAAAGRTSDILREDERFLSQSTRFAMSALRIGGGRYDAKKLISLPASVRRRIIADILAENNLYPSHFQVIKIDEMLADGHGKLNIARDFFVIVRKDAVFVENIQQNY